MTATDYPENPEACYTEKVLVAIFTTFMLIQKQNVGNLNK